MTTNIMKIFYGVDCLPYKDQERTVHFPIVGQAFQGASNTTKIRFYYGGMGSINTSWVAISKLPNGKIGSKVLTRTQDTELNEYYCELDLSSYYTQCKGDLYISLQGYEGGVVVNYDSESETYTILGTPTIQATGSVKLTIAYATEFIGGDEAESITFQQLLALIGQKADNDIVVKTIGDITEDLQTADYIEDNDIVFDKNSNILYRIVDSGGIKTYQRMFGATLQIVHSSISQTIANIYDLTAKQPFIFEVGGILWLVSLNTSASQKSFVAYCLSNNSYSAGTVDNTTPLTSAILANTKHIIPVVSISTSSGTLTIADYVKVRQMPSYLIYQDDLFVHCAEDTNNHYFKKVLLNEVLETENYVQYGEVWFVVNKSARTYTMTTSTFDFYTKQNVDSLISTISANSFIVVDTTTYPTLQDFLDNYDSPEEGHIYLYPIDKTDLTKGYHQYIYEDSAWLYLGTTQIDLSDYYTQTQVNNLLDDKVDKKTTANTLYGVNGSGTQTQYSFGSAVGNNWVVQRDANGQVLVPETPNSDSSATSRKYVSDTYMTIANGVAKTFTIAGVDMQDNISSQELTDALTFANLTTDLDYAFVD